ncbi:MAG: DUF2877 domain-containing protein [Bacillota bacterium]
MYLLKIQVKKIDESIYRQIQTVDNIKIHSVFSNTINLIIDETLIAIGSNISSSKHHVLIERVNFAEYKITSSSILEQCKSGFRIDELFFAVSEEAVVSFNAYKCIKTIKEEHLIKACILLEWIKQEPRISIVNYDNSDSILNYQFKHIYRFLEEETFETAVKIVGLGVGLTPLGDDFLLGYILAKTSLGIKVPWVSKIISIAKEKMTIISYQALIDVLNGYYTEEFINMIEEFFEEETFNQAKLIMNYGATSGAGILVGFIFGLLPKGELRNECLESIKKHLL